MKTFGGFVMHIRKGYFIRKISKNKVLILNFSLIILIFCSVLTHSAKKNKNESSLAYVPLYNIDTNKSVYTVTVDIHGEENINDVKLLSNVLKGMNVEATFFVTTDWIKKNDEIINKLSSDGHKFALQIIKEQDNNSRSDTMKFLANENDSFYNVCEYYPRYVRINCDNVGKIPELLNAFGQEYVSASHIFSRELKIIKEGSIILIKNIVSETPYEIAEYIGYCTEKGYKSISLNELVNINTEIKEDISES